MLKSKYYWLLTWLVQSEEYQSLEVVIIHSILVVFVSPRIAHGALSRLHFLTYATKERETMIGIWIICVGFFCDLGRAESTGVIVPAQC